jgi:hypothetical protein
MFLCIKECFVNGRRYVPNNPKKNIGEFAGVESHPCFKEVADVPKIPIIDDKTTLRELAPPLGFQKKVTPEIEQEMRDLRAGGVSVQDVAHKFNVSVSTVLKYTKSVEKEE